MGRPMYYASRRVDDGEWTFNLGIPSGVGLEAKDVHDGTVGEDKRWWNDSPTAAESLAARMVTMLDSHADAAVFTAVLSRTTGKWTIASDGATFSITWLSTAMRDWFGFTGNLAGANTYTSDNIAQGLIFMDSGRLFEMDWTPETDTSEGQAESGAQSGLGSGNVRWEARYEHQWEPQTAASLVGRIASGIRDLSDSVVPWTVDDFWLHCKTFHGPVRYYDDRTGAIGSYENGWDLYFAGLQKYVKSRKIAEVTTFYRVPMRMQRHVVAGG